MADFMIKDVRLSFPDLWTAVEFKKGDGKPRWNATFLVVPGSENDKRIRAEIDAEAKEVFGKTWEKTLAGLINQKNQSCYLDGNTKDYDGYEGMMALSTHRAAKLKNGSPNTRPAIIDRDKSPLAQDDGKPYAGCYVNAKVSIYCQGGENPGVRASFSVVQFVRDGDEFGSGAPKVDEFDDLGADADAPDELA